MSQTSLTVRAFRLVVTSWRDHSLVSSPVMSLALSKRCSKSRNTQRHLLTPDAAGCLAFTQASNSCQGLVLPVSRAIFRHRTSETLTDERRGCSPCWQAFEKQDSRDELVQHAVEKCGLSLVVQNDALRCKELSRLALVRDQRAHTSANFRLPCPFEVAPAILDDPIGCVVLQMENQRHPTSTRQCSTVPGFSSCRADVPDVPLACERESLTLCQRLTVVTLCGADSFDAAFDLADELADAHLGILRRRSRRQRQLGFPSLSVQPLIFRADILRDAFADRRWSVTLIREE